MDIYSCNRCGNEWPDYEPHACPFCFSQEIRLVERREYEEIQSMERDGGSKAPLVDTVSGRRVSE